MGAKFCCRETVPLSEERIFGIGRLFIIYLLVSNTISFKRQSQTWLERVMLPALTSRSTESFSLGKCSAVPQHNKHFFFFLLGKEEKIPVPHFWTHIWDFSFTVCKALFYGLTTPILVADVEIAHGPDSGHTVTMQSHRWPLRSCLAWCSNSYFLPEVNCVARAVCL